MMTSANDENLQASGPDEQQSIMARFQAILALDSPPSITLTNIYKEMPISHPASICDIRGCHLELSTSELQLAAISQCSEVYIRSTHLEVPVLGRLESIDVRRGLVQLSNFSYTELWEEKRETVRVRFKRPTSIIIHSGTDRISGVIHDISLGGCCVSTLVRQGLGESDDIQVELKVIDKATGQPNCTRVPSSMVQIIGDSAPFKCTFRFRHNQQSEAFLSALINQRQFEILKELRESL